MVRGQDAINNFGGFAKFVYFLAATFSMSTSK
jgi:hypothetical protein